MKDLVILVADKNTQFVLEGLLQRPFALNIRQINYDIFIHPMRDPGVYNNAAQFLRPFINQYRYALVSLDREGSGQEDKEAAQISAEIQKDLNRNGWQDRCEVIVFDPELEIWAWVNSEHLAQNLGWPNVRDLKEFIQGKGIWTTGRSKPERPKEAIEHGLREKGIQRSSAIYKKIAERVSFRGCEDRSFLRFTSVLRRWFPKGDEDGTAR